MVVSMYMRIFLHMRVCILFCVSVCLRNGVIAYVHVRMRVFVCLRMSVYVCAYTYPLLLPFSETGSRIVLYPSLIQRWLAVVPSHRSACQGKAIVATPEETRVLVFTKQIKIQAGCF